MAIKQYAVYPKGKVACTVCGTHDEVTTDENGDDICIECLFERETNGYYEEDNEVQN